MGVDTLNEIIKTMFSLLKKGKARTVKSGKEFMYQTLEYRKEKYDRVNQSLKEVKAWKVRNIH